MKKQLIAALFLGLSFISLDGQSRPLPAQAQNTPSMVKQCIKNDAVITLDIYWIHPSFIQKDSNGNILKLAPGTKEAAFDQALVNQGRCREFTERHYAVLKIAGKGNLRQFMQVLSVVLTAQKLKGGGKNSEGYIGTAYPSTTRYTVVRGNAGDGPEGGAYFYDNVGAANPPAFEFFTGGEPGPKSISFSNQAGYVAEMSVMYFQKQPVGNSYVDMPVVKSSGKISVGQTAHINIPVAISNQPITVTINGVATVKPNVYGTTVPANFSGNKCYKAFGTIFDAKGSTCK